MEGFFIMEMYFEVIRYFNCQKKKVFSKEYSYSFIKFEVEIILVRILLLQE